MAEARVSALVEGAILAALTAVLALLGLFIPPLQVVTNLIWTIPIVVLIVRRDFRTGVMATVVTGLVVLLFVGPVRALFLILQFGGLGLVYGYLFRIRSGAGKAILGGAVVAAVSIALTIGLSLVISGMPFQDVDAEMRQIVDSAMEMYARMGLLDQLERQGTDPETLKVSLEQMARLMLLLLPGAMVAGAAISAFINFLLARMVLLRLGLYAPELPPFREWQLPWYGVWGIIIGLALWQGGDYWQWPVVKVIGQNIMYIYFPLLLVSGLSVLTFFYYRVNLSPFIKVMVGLLIMLNFPLAMMAVLAVGLFDPLFNYRRLARGE